MSQAPNLSATRTDVTRQLATYASDLSYARLSDKARTVGKHALLDWLAVTLAGGQEPLVAILRDEAATEGLGSQATLLGLGARGSVGQAALINGAAGHALDYDDVHPSVGGHPTVPVAPVALALSERDSKSGTDLLTALIAGIETEARVGCLIGDARDNGWHQTSTVGVFGGAAAAASLLGLDAEKTIQAFGIAGTQAAGVMASFGTMCKPLHAGMAAESGLRAAEWAARGFTGASDILEHERGFAATHGLRFDAEAALAGMGETFFCEDILFKHHAACYGTHSAIECAQLIRKNPAFDLDKIEKVEIRVHTRITHMCDIPAPTDGLGIKFSLRMTMALALSGEPTSALHVYSEEHAARPDLVAIRDKVTSVVDDRYGYRGAGVTVHLSDGTAIHEDFDVAVPESDLTVQEAKLTEKFLSLAEPVIGDHHAQEVLGIVLNLETLAATADLTEHLSSAQAG
ncbi:MAG: MmgE/PrpD family protein [Rhodospirillaceae bacterium]|nr:MmgE/PrpD family protein [Rhodospirillaceae bacterium]